MKRFLQQSMGKSKIEEINFDELKTRVDGEGLIKRVQYRKNTMRGNRPAVAKGQKVQLMHVKAENLEEKLKNEHYGFQCLHYSVSEAKGVLKVIVLNKKREEGSIRCATYDDTATAGSDYVKTDKLIKFKKGDSQFVFEVKIIDDEGWEPDEDFYIQLY